MMNTTQRLMRSRNDRMVAGVAGGIARYLGVDPVLVRLVFVALVFTGVGMLAYPIMWLVMPLEPASGAAPVNGNAQAWTAGQPLSNDAGEEIPVQNVPPAGASDAELHQRRNRTLGTVLVAVGAFLAINAFFPAAASLVFPLVLIAAGVLLVRRTS